MKAFIISLALVAPAFAAASESFEVNSKGCMFSATNASCVVANKHQWDMMCNMSMTVKTMTGAKINKDNKMLISAKRFQMIEAQSVEQNPIVDATIFAVCTIVQ